MGELLHRRELEDEWRQRAQIALRRYRTAKAAACEAQAEHSSGLTPPPDGTLAMIQALRAETAALNEYRQVLLIFNDLVISGKLPPDEQGN